MARPRLVTCDHCGEEFPAGRLACPECGSDAETGWKDAEELAYQSVEIPDYYEDPSHTGVWTPRRRWFVVALVVALVAFVLAFVAPAL